VLKKLLGLVLLVAAGSAYGELKIAVIDTQRAMLESEEAKALMQAAQTELQPEQSALQALGQEIQKLREQFQKDAEVMSDTDRRSRQKQHRRQADRGGIPCQQAAESGAGQAAGTGSADHSEARSRPEGTH